MKHINKSYHPIIDNDFTKTNKFETNKLMYNKYNFSLFRINQNKIKNSSEKSKAFSNFNSIFKNIFSPIKNEKRKYSLLYINTFNNNKKFNDAQNLKKLKLYTKKNNCNNNIYINTNSFKSRNIKNLSDLMNTNYSSLNRIVTTSEEKTLKDKLLVIKPLSRTQIANNKSENKNINYKNNKKNDISKNKRRIFSSTHFIKVNNIKNDYRQDRENINNIKNKIKVILYKDLNDMRPRNRFKILKTELLKEESKINKMFMKFKKQISKQEQLVKWINETKIKRINKKESQH